MLNKNFNLSTKQTVIILLILAGVAGILNFFGVFATPPTPPIEQSVESTREEKFRAQFNEWDGTHINSKKAILVKLYDPDSFKIIETKYVDEGDKATIQTEFTATNASGGRVRNKIRTEVDADGNVLKLWEVE